MNRVRLSDPGHLLALGLGSGLSPRAPGTAGTLVAVPLAALACTLSLGAYLALCAVLFLAGIWICGRTARSLGVHDHPSIVFDEVVGFLVTMAGAPCGVLWWVAGFVLFRCFDILKPWPVRVLDRRVHGGLGIMLDDLVAGLMALAVLQGGRALWA